MTKVTVYDSFLKGLLLPFALMLFPDLHAQYRLQIHMAEHERQSVSNLITIPASFPGRMDCLQFITRLTGKLQAEGYAAASLEMIGSDTVQTEVNLYVGERYRFGRIRINTELESDLASAGIRSPVLSDVNLEPSRWKLLQEELLSYYEENGYPFASVGLDSIQILQGEFEARMVVRKGPFYKIDSVSNQGSAIISGRFLHRYLGILPGAPYKKSALGRISQKLRELPFLEEQYPWTLTRLGTGAVVNVFLEPKKSSQANVLVGLLPATETQVNAYEPLRNRFQLTGEALIKLRNSFGKGETIGLNWQQLQLRSPRLNLLYEQPYIAGSPFGVQFSFDLFKKDSSFLNLNGMLGMSFAASSNSGGALFLQWQQSNLLSIDTLFIKTQKTLPSSADIRSASLGVSYDYNHTDYRTNPLKGTEAHLYVSAGTKTVRQNASITRLTDSNSPDFRYSELYDSLKGNTYQLRVKINAAHFLRISRASTLKTALHAGWFQSPSVFRNELFQIGGYRLLRGFDEESIYASSYGVATLEYRYLFGRNSHFFVFSDLATARNAAVKMAPSYSFIGAGLGMMLETKTGILNISLAAGKRNDQPLNLRQAKIHFGYVSYF